MGTLQPIMQIMELKLRTFELIIRPRAKGANLVGDNANLGANSMDLRADNANLELIMRSGAESEELELIMRILGLIVWILELIMRI